MTFGQHLWLKISIQQGSNLQCGSQFETPLETHYGTVRETEMGIF
jgi:hypothetical protein